MGKVNREEAQSLLILRVRKDDKTIKDYAFDLKRLASLAYRSFTQPNTNIITKDYFVKGLHVEMQLKLKSLEKFSTAGIDDLIEEAVRLELTGVKPSSKGTYSHHCVNSVNVTGEANREMLEPIIARLEKLENRLSTGEDKSVNHVRSSSYENKLRHPKDNTGNRKCRNCGNAQHFVRQCPSRFCQAGGEKGNDAWDKKCKKYC